MIKPRNTLVLVRLYEKPEQQVGKITVPNLNELYTEAEVLAIGPGTQVAAGAISETHDLAVGQRVQVKHKNVDHRGPKFPANIAGIKFVQNGEVLHIFEQASIIGILAEPGSFVTKAEVAASQQYIGRVLGEDPNSVA